MKDINSTHNNENNITENFFKILISKELIHKNYFEIYYKTFLDKNGDFDVKEFKKKLNEIYELVKNNNVTSFKPEIISGSEKQIIIQQIRDTIKNILLEYGNTYEGHEPFSEELIIHFNSGIIKMDSDMGLSEEEIKKVRNGMNEHLVKYYKQVFFHEKVRLTMDEVVEKIIKILTKKQD